MVVAVLYNHNTKKGGKNQLEIFKTILEIVFIALPLFGGGGFFFWKALQLEKARNDEYIHTLETITKTCGHFQIWLLQNTRKEGDK